MATTKVCQCACNRTDCSQCDKNLGYAISRFFSEVKAIEAEQNGGVRDTKFIYTGKQDVDKSGICDVLMLKDKTEYRGTNFVCEMQLADGLVGNMADYVKAYEDSSYNGHSDSVERMLNLYTSGKLFITPFKIGDKINPYSRDAWAMYESLTKIKSIKYNVEKTENGTFGYTMKVITNVQIGDKHEFTPQEMIENFAIGGYITKNTAKWMRFTTGGLIRPVCIMYKDCKVLIDNAYIYVDNGQVTMPVGCWGANGIQVTTALNAFLTNNRFKLVNDAVNCLAKVRKFIPPYWCMTPNVIKAE